MNRFCFWVLKTGTCFICFDLFSKSGQNIFVMMRHWCQKKRCCHLRSWNQHVSGQNIFVMSYYVKKSNVVISSWNQNVQFASLKICQLSLTPSHGYEPWACCSSAMLLPDAHDDGLLGMRGPCKSQSSTSALPQETKVDHFETGAPELAKNGQWSWWGTRGFNGCQQSGSWHALVAPVLSSFSGGEGFWGEIQAILHPWHPWLSALVIFAKATVQLLYVLWFKFFWFRFKISWVIDEVIETIHFVFSRSFAPAELQLVTQFEQQINGFLSVDAEVNSGRAAVVWPCLLHACYPTLVGKSLTQCLLAVLIRGYRNQVDGGLDYVEVFAGRANLSREFHRAGYEGASFDVLFSEQHNMLSVRGVRLVLDAVTSLKRGGMLWIATVCSSFVVLCRAQSQRNEGNSYLGDLQRRFVREGNSLAEASSLLFLVAFLLEIYVALENPQSSVIDKCPSLCGCFAFVKPWCFTTYMGAFFGRSVKPLYVWTTLESLSALEVGRPSNIADDELVVRNGSQFTGRKDLLQDSEIYTPQFGRAVLRVFEEIWRYHP